MKDGFSSVLKLKFKVRSKLLIEEYKTESEILKEDIINLKVNMNNFSIINMVFNLLFIIS